MRLEGNAHEEIISEYIEKIAETGEALDMHETMWKELERYMEEMDLSEENKQKHMSVLPAQADKPEAAPKRDLPKASKIEPMTPKCGSYVLSIWLQTGCYRHIRISADALLSDLHSAILDAFDFDDDHAHAFFMDNRAWSHEDAYFVDRIEDADRYTSQYTLREALPSGGAPFKYLFDFGDEWVFQCKLLKMLNEGTDEAMVVRSVGEISQYGDEDEWDEEDEDDEDEGFRQQFSESVLKSMYAKLALPQKMVELLHAYFNAFANFYNIITLDVALKIFNAQNDPISEQDFLAFVEIARHEDHGYYIVAPEDIDSGVVSSTPLEHELVYDELLDYDNGGYAVTKAEQEGKPYYVPEKTMLLRYASDDFYEKTPALLEIESFLHGQMNLTEKRAQALADAFECVASHGERSLKHYFVEVTKANLIFDTPYRRDAFIALLTDLVNNTRMMRNRGHTLNELGLGIQFNAKEGWGGIPTLKKVGRNEPCHCGSGIKYKHCCGKVQ